MAHLLYRVSAVALCGWWVQSVQAGITVDPFVTGAAPNQIIGAAVQNTGTPVELAGMAGSAPVGETDAYGLLSEVAGVVPEATPSQSSAIELATWAQPTKRRGWSCGGFKVKPYGAFWSDMIYQTRGTVPGHFTLYVPSSETQRANAFYIDMRRSRFGIDVEGPKIGAFAGAKSKGRLEIDFIGDFITANQPKARLRHAYWEVGDEDFRLLVGQTWDVISPLYPETLNFSVGWMGGDIGFRRAQFRAERYLHPSDEVTITLQGSLNEVITADFTSDPAVRREVNGWPTVEGRAAIAWDNYLGGGQRSELGFSGHIGETAFDFLQPGPPPLNLPPANDERYRTWSFNVDMRYPVGPRAGVQCAYFTGANLGTFLGGIGQGVCPCLRVPIRASGGWLDLWYDWTTRLHSHVGFGIDDPNNSDSLLGRSYNRFIFANITFDVTDKLLTGFEVTSWKTLYHEERAGLNPPVVPLSPSSPGDSTVLQWMVKYGF